MTLKPTLQETKTTRSLIDGLTKELVASHGGYSEQEFLIAIKDGLKCLDLPIDKETVEIIAEVVNAQVNPTVDKHYTRGQVWAEETEVEWIWDGWIAKGYFNTITAMQKVGKSTFVLDFIKAICDGNEEFLNFSLFSEKKDVEFVLIGPDMNRRLWGKYGKMAELLKNDNTAQAYFWHEQIRYVFSEEDEFGLRKADLNRMVTMANEIKADGKHPFFVMDSYSAMLSMSGYDLSENDSRYANPLRELKLALGQTGATVVLLHHSSLSSSKRSAEASNSGHQSFNRVPDQCLALKWLAEPGIDGTRTDRRIVLSASGRTGRVMEDQLLEQSLDWGWSSHGDIGFAMRTQRALEERDRLAGDDAICFDLLNTRTTNGVGTTTADLSELRESTSGGRGHWGNAKIWRLLQKLQRRGLAYVDGEQRRPGDFGGTPSKVWFTFEREKGLDSPAKDHDSRNSGFQTNPPTSVNSHDSQDSVDSHDSAYGDNPPSERQMVEDANGKNSLVIVELLPGTGDVRAQKFGDASAPIKQMRWMLDAFPCGWHAKHNPPTFDDNEEI